MTESNPVARINTSISLSPKGVTRPFSSTVWIGLVLRSMSWTWGLSMTS